MENKKRIVSGITPSSSNGLHIGNYLGAVKPHVDFQDKGNCMYFIADYHALNTVFDKDTFKHNVYETYLDYLALGIDTQKTIFFIESQVKPIFELTEILNNVVTYGEMKRMHAFKDKLTNENDDVENINMGLFTYPILMSADILVFDANIVPVGEDQTQHVEICREMARSFNNRYGNTVKVPELYVKKEVGRVLGTDGVRKMSKTLGNDITIFASEEKIKKQIRGIVTDPNRIHKDDPGDPSKNVIFYYLRFLGYPDTEIKSLEAQYIQGTIGDVAIKDLFCEYFLEYFKVARKKRNELSKQPTQIHQLIKENGEKANEIALPVIERIRKAIGATYLFDTKSE